MNPRALTRRKEWRPSLFDDFFTRPWSDWLEDGSGGRTLSVPAVNISERKDDFLVTMAAPGLKKDDFEITLEDSLLTISSEREEGTQKEGEKFSRKEYSYSSFERCFALPQEVNQDAIDAKYENGVLSLVLPKKEEAKKPIVSKQISVN